MKQINEQADNPRNQDGIVEKELLVVSVGTAQSQTRLTIGAIEDTMAKAFPQFTVRRCFTNQTILDRIKQRDGVAIDNVQEALRRAEANGVRKLVIQPTHMMDGLEYRKMVTEAAEYSNSFGSLSIGDPLLTSDKDFQIVADTLVSCTSFYHDEVTAVCFMGHGTEAASNEVYAKMQNLLWDIGRKNYFIGTMEAPPTVQDVLSMVKAGNYRRVVLRPLMIVSGGHVNHHMAGTQTNSWKRIFERAGYEVVCIQQGLGDLEPIRQLLTEHTRAAIKE